MFWLDGSRKLKGSSSITIFGLARSAETMPTFCLLPADRSRISFPAPIISSVRNSLYCSTVAFTVSSGISFTLPTNRKYSSGERKSMRNPSFTYAPTKCFQSSHLAGLRSSSSSDLLNPISPSVAFMRSRISLKRVVLPAPLFPTRPKMVPSGIISSGISTALCSP